MNGVLIICCSENYDGRRVCGREEVKSIVIC